MQHETIIVFDIETVPDTAATIDLLGLDRHMLPEEANDREAYLRQALESYHLELTKGNNAFPRQLFHRVVAISFLEAHIDYHGARGETYQLKQLRSGGTIESSEAELVQGFFHFLSKKKPRFVTFNGRTFDLPVLKYRAMKYGVAVPWLYQAGDKWNNYMQRYSMNWHCDLLEALSDYGASARIKMNEICTILGLPGKIGVDGANVVDMYEGKQLKAIRDYCETDVLNTYLVYLHYQRHTGTLPEEGFLTALDDIRQYLRTHEASDTHLKEFREAWEALDTKIVAPA